MCPFVLLSINFKLYEQLLLARISPTIYSTTPIEQAGFRQGRSCMDQVLTLTIGIETGFQREKKVGVALIDLTAAYDVFWKHSVTAGNERHSVPENHLILGVHAE